MKGKQAAEATLGAAAGKYEDEEEDNGDGFHGFGILDTGCGIRKL